MKFCQNCGTKIEDNTNNCPQCGTALNCVQPQIIINNSNNNVNTVGVGYGRLKNKWVSFGLCVGLGYFGAHKFYEGKIGTGILYLCTGGLCGFGWIIDTFNLLCKPNPYMVY